MKRWREVLVLVVSLAVPARVVAGDTQAKPGSSVEKAREALGTGHAAEAVRLAEVILEAAPANREAADVKVRALLELGDLPRARTAYTRFAVAARTDDSQLLGAIALADLRDIAARFPSDIYLKVDALERLARAGESAALEELRRMAGDAAGTGVGVVADAALARRGEAAAADRLAAAVTSDRIRDKSIIADALRLARARDQAAALLPLLHDDAADTRAAAAEALGALGYKAAIADLRPLLSDDRAIVRTRAAIALKRLGDSSGEAIISALRASPVGGARLAAMEVSDVTSAPERQSTIERASRDRDPFARLAAAAASAPTNPAAARDVLVKLLDEPDTAVRREAARTLETWMPGDAALRRLLLTEQNAWVRVHAAGAVLNAARAKGGTGRASSR